MKFRQHIRVYGYPDALKQKIPTKASDILEIKGFGKVNVVGVERAKNLHTLLSSQGIECRLLKRPDMVRVRYLLSNNGLHKAVRGRKYKGDLLYTIDANDERELLDKRDAALEELKTLKVNYEDVCRWVCESSPKLDTKKTFKPRRKTVTEKIQSKIEGIQQEIAELKEKPIKKAMVDDRAVMKGVLR